ncbi:beta-taxilin isoform 1-T1 [Clarias gariepinus]
MESAPQLSASDQANCVEEKPVDPMEVFSRQLEDIINTYGSACSLMEEKISILQEEDEEKLYEETMAKDMDANTGTCSSPETEQTASQLLEGLGKDALLLLESLKTLITPEEKLDMVMRKYAELLKEQKAEEVHLKLLQKKQGFLVKQRDRLQLDHSKGILARSKLENLCRELHKHNTTLKEDMQQKCQEDEKKRAEISCHFQNTVVDIQAQIEHHSSRNNKLCQDNTELANKLTSIIQQCEKRDESFEKIFKQKNLQQQLSDTKLQEANMLLKEAEEKHKREKEYLLKEAIDKTKKCFEMKKQELQLKKQLVLYSQKFDEFQATLAKSNEVYVAFKQEMEKMTKKMKKLEKESNVWKIRFESCNKALADMIEERSEKGKELELFTLKIAKLETLCRALQEERKVLYDKIKDIRLQSISSSAHTMDIVKEEIPELPELSVSEPVHNPALTAEMEKLWKEQARLQEFAASLMASTADDIEGSDNEEESSESAQLVPHVPVANKPPTEEHILDQGVEKVHKLETKTEQATVEPPKDEPLKKAPQKAQPSKTEQPKKEPAKAESPIKELRKVEPPKVEAPKAEPAKPEPPKEEATKVEPLKTESLKEEPPNTSTLQEEPPKTEPCKAEPPKEELHKLEPPKEELHKLEPTTIEVPKAEPIKEQPPKEEPPKTKPFKDEPPKEKQTKLPTKNIAKVEPIKQDAQRKKSNKPNSVQQKETKLKEVKRVTIQAEVPEINYTKNELHTQEDPKGEPAEEAPGIEVEPSKVEPIIAEPPAPKTSTAGAAKPQNAKSQEAKPDANKPHSKKQGYSKKKGAAKGTKKT